MPFPNLLKIAVVAFPPFFIINGNASNYSISGTEARFLQTLSEALGFRYELLTPPDREWGRLQQDGNWTGIIGMVQRKEADMALCALGITHQRFEALNISEYYFSDSIKFVARIPGLASKANAYLHTFQSTIWISSFVTLSLAVISFHIISIESFSSVELFFQMVGSITGQPLTIEANSLKRKILIIAWIIFAFVLSSCYKAVLSSFLTVPLKLLPVRNFIELEAAVRNGNYKCFVIDKTVHLSLLKSAKRKEMRALAEYIERYNWKLNGDESLSQNLDKTSAIIAAETNLLYDFGSEIGKEVYISDDVLLSGYVGIVFSKEFCCSERLNSAISKFRECGLYQKFLRDELLKKSSQNAYSKEKDIKEWNNVEDLKFFMKLLSAVIERLLARLITLQHIYAG
ncbi:probable glutamate receptor [Stegodyphus dumicola]|uniref:probable glutamate receptor n=1 Tax=Stegodyphus dumicola TaxID=202533 RepID=UPI0015AF7202|nr:probable glutamate receptor [Stegodyphus dumicola]